MNIKGVDVGQWIQEQAVAQLRDRLREQTGVLVSDILAEIAKRRDAIITESPAYADDIPPYQAAEDDDEEPLSDERIW